ncbi:MAG: hypothetical protein LBT05_11695 [Planctomycetaceae bacterium]|jgi:hypothetical protein|nr:hypothetical protein [Planctomycetaceae bacterium]
MIFLFILSSDHLEKLIPTPTFFELIIGKTSILRFENTVSVLLIAETERYATNQPSKT